MNILDIYMNETNTGSEQDELIFSLDIGTRSVVGVVGKSSENGFEVLDFEQAFHGADAMRDGQIEDIGMVAAVVKQVKETLQKRNLVQFTKVAVAAAGRALKTSRACYEQELDESKPIDIPFINFLEYSAVNAAQDVFLNESADCEESFEEKGFYCVGYSVVEYKLDGYSLKNIKGHKGNHILVEVIAAFLPHNVVRSIHTVATMNGLEVDNLTLEPIAAINVIAPRDIRLLNIAIVDIGGGTSDIAISKNGRIIAYGMVTLAGDEITETIMHALLTDYDTSERIKVEFSQTQGKISYMDILGNVHEISPDEVYDIIKPVADNLCDTVSNSILNLNETPPEAVFLVGGSSQIPGLCKKIAENLEITPNRVAVGGKQKYKEIVLCSEKLISPEFVTPIGIGVVGALHKSCNFFSVVVNDQKIMILERENITILDALLNAGIKPSKLIGLTARNLTFTLNGEQVVKKGTPPVRGILTLNGVIASIDAPIKAGDTIVAQEGKNGEMQVVSISDIAEEFAPFTVTLDGERVEVRYSFIVNGKQVSDDYIIINGDEVASIIPQTLKELFACINIKTNNQMAFTINGEVRDKESAVRDGDVICIKLAEPEKPFDSVLSICINGEWREIEIRSGETLIFADLLNFVDIDTDRRHGSLILRINGQDASYAQKINDADIIEIYWEN